MNADTVSRLEELERRMGAMEVVVMAAESGRSASPPDLRQLEELRRRDGPKYVRGGLSGAVTYAGSASFGDGEVLWAGERGLPQIWDMDPRTLAPLLAALGHPARIALVRALLTGERTSQELQDVIGSPSAGQLYHHLKDLIASGVVDQAGRSRYRVSAGRIVPLLVILAAAGDVARPHDPEMESEPVDLKEN
jgi:ArsR family transcriptional regulator, arsenate/arsenite/antimonite-responsive transcriptional repressor